jgi:PRA1 family protein
VKVPPLRRPAAFFGLGEPKPFSLPSATDVVPRLKQNLPHYASNYGAFYLLLCTITIITSPISLMSLTLSGAGWYFVTKAGADPQQDSIKYVVMILTLCDTHIQTPRDFFCLFVICNYYNKVHVLHAAAYVYVLRVLSCRIGSLAIKKQIAYAGMGIVTVLVSLLLLSTLVGWSLWLTLVCGLAHASVRDATALIDAAEANQVL